MVFLASGDPDRPKPWPRCSDRKPLTPGLIKESLIISGWVALWRPLEIFLYDWWPDPRRCAGCTTGWRCDAGQCPARQARCAGRASRKHEQSDPATGALNCARAAVRGVSFLWVVVDQSAKPANLVVGVLACRGGNLGEPEAAAARQRSRAPRPAARAAAALPVAVAGGRQSTWRAAPFAPHASICSPGFVDLPAVSCRPALARNAFELIASLMPGSVPSDESERHDRVHCLDTRQPVVEQLTAEERAYGPALQPGTRRYG